MNVSFTVRRGSRPGLVRRVSTVGAALLLVSLPAAAPAAAAVRSSDACTHNWSGPQICISIYGHDQMARSLKAIWKNPPKNVQQSQGIIHEGDAQREVHTRAVGRRSGGEIVAEWTHLELVEGKVCVGFADTGNVWACQDVYGTGRGD